MFFFEKGMDFFKKKKPKLSSELNCFCYVGQFSLKSFFFLIVFFRIYVFKILTFFFRSYLTPKFSFIRRHQVLVWLYEQCFHHFSACFLFSPFSWNGTKINHSTRLFFQHPLLAFWFCPTFNRSDSFWPQRVFMTNLEQTC